MIYTRAEVHDHAGMEGKGRERESDKGKKTSAFRVVKPLGGSRPGVSVCCHIADIFCCPVREYGLWKPLMSDDPPLSLRYPFGPKHGRNRTFKAAPVHMLGLHSLVRTLDCTLRDSTAGLTNPISHLDLS